MENETETTEVEEQVTEPETEEVEADDDSEPVVEEAVIEGADAPVAERAEAEEEDEDDTPAYDPAAAANATKALPQVQPLDVNKFVDEDGRIDMVAYNQAVTEQMSQQIAAATQAAVQQATTMNSLQNQYNQDWAKAETKFPELKKDPGLREVVMAVHAQSAAAGGKYKSPLAAAKEIMALRGGAKAEGVKQAQTTRTVQAAASLASPNAPTTSASKRSVGQLREKMRNATNTTDRRAATNSVIKAMIESGQL
jgi:hypothetical protein